uniref:Dynein axonemal light chain 1 n=1 Tax=Physcomitrium patens TaxID=3218 RepID=A0A7I4FJ54_PHYPA
MEQDDKLWQQRYEQEQRVYELQRELEFSNATLRKMTVTWEIYEEPPAKTKKLEEEEKNTTAQRIGRAFRERKRCRELVYCCTLIQKVFRGFLSRRIFRELKGQRSKEILKSTAKNREAAFKNLVRVSEISSPEEYESAMERALSLDLGEEVELIQERREAAKVEMSNWLRQVPASCLGSRSLIVSDKIKEARRLGLTTLAEATQAIMLEKENNILTELEISMRSGALKVFHQCQRKSKFFGLGEPVEKYSAEFRERVAMVQKRLMQASVRNYEANVLNLLLEGSDLGLETEVAAVVRNIRSQVLRFAKGLIEKISIFISKGDGFLEKWSELQSWGKVFGIGEDVLKSLMQAIGCSVLLEHTKVKRSLVVVLECDFMGRPVCYSCETQSAILNVKDLELKYSDSNIEASESVKRKFSGYVTIPSLDTYSKSWNKIGKLKNRWKNHCSQAFLKTLPSKRRAEPLGISKTQQDVVLKTHHHQSGAHYTREAIDISSVEENGVVDHVIDGDYWYTLRPHLRGMESSSSCTLTRKLLESSAHCNRTGLLGVTKLSIPHKELTSLGIGMLGRWCPKLRIFMINENRLSTLKGAFYGCEGSLEYVLVKDNLLNDLEGLESLQNLKVLFLEGNFISCIGSGTGVQIDSEEMNVAAAKTSGSSCLSTTPRASCRSYQGTPRIAEVRTDSTRRECVTSRDTNKHRASTLWPKLEKLSLGNNRISRIWELGSLFPNLEVLDLRSNELVTLGGYEGKGLSGLKHLRLLDVGQNKIKGRSLWNGLGHCQLLVSLVASRNRLTELPTHFGSVMLREIWLNGNCIRRLACKAWLPNLQRFYLQDNLIDNLESLYGCPSLEVLDISFNNVSQLTQLNHLASLRRLRTLQMNDNPISDQEDHVGKVLEAVPWLIELDNELVEDSFREKAVQSIFSKNMAVAGIRYLDEKIARAERPFLSFANPKDVTKHWLGGFSDRSDSSNQSGLAKLEANNRDIIAVMQENWNHLAFQEMLESHRKSQSWSKETSLRKEFFGQESKSGPQMTKGTNLSNEGIMSVSHNVERYLSDHLEDEDFKYKNVFKENLEYKADIEVELSRVRRLQALARDMLTRKRLIKMQKLAVDVLAPREAHTEAERRRYQSSALRIQGAWRRWVRRKFMISVVKLQAYWRGIRTRKRFRQALSKLQFIDDDDFEYVAVDESEYTLDPTVFEKNFIPSKFRVSVEALVCLTKRFNMETSSKEEIQAKISNKEGCGSGSSENIDPWLTRSADKLRGTEVAIPYDFSQSDDMRIQNEEMETPSQSVKRLYRMKSTGSRFHLPKIEVAPTTAATPPLDASNSLITSAGEISIVVQNEVFQRSLKETPRCAIESDRKAKAHLCGKEVRAEKKKTTIAEIAKDWGFNDERTAEAYMKSRTKVMKKLEKVKAVHQGAQSRFELFKARSEETLAHSPQCVHVKKTAQRPRKIKHEVKDVPDEDTTSLDKFHGWSPSSAAADATNTTGHHLLFSGDDTRKHPCVSVLAVRRRDNRNCRR